MQKYNDELADLISKMIYNSDTLFYGLFLHEVNRSFSRNIPTACLSHNTVSGQCELLFNPDYWDTLTVPQRNYLIKHETLHLMESHYLFSQEFGWDPKIANYAMDCRINSYLNSWKSNNFKIDMPTGGITPSMFKLDELMDSRYYYDELCKIMPKGGGSYKLGPGEQGQGNDEDGNGIDPNKDIHPLWKGLQEGVNELERTIIRKKMEETIERIADETVKSQGTLPANVKHLMDNKIKIAPAAVSWKALFRQFAGKNVSTEQFSTRKKPNKRFPDSPGYKFDVKVKCVLAIDSSGSMSDYDINEGTKELYHIKSKGGLVDYFSWDATTGDTVEFKNKLEFTREKCGGTDPNCAIIKINENPNKYDFAVLFGDGYWPKIHTKCKIPLIILITSAGDHKIQSDYPYKIIKINDK